jgi:hypothetical protein
VGVGFPLLIIAASFTHTHLTPLSDVWDSPDQAAHYHILSTMKEIKETGEEKTN